MAELEALYEKIDACVDRQAGELEELARAIHAHPELRFQEHDAARRVTDLLEAHGHRVERGAGGLDTALRSTAGAGPGPTIAILGEYDALPEIGHACGHHLIAAGAVGAFLAAAAAIDGHAGRIVFLGTPAEEGGGGKIRMLEAGVFEGIDCAMMFHPFDRDLLAHPTLASTWIDMQFIGRPAHAAAAPHQGRSALTACMDAFRLIDGQRIHFRDGARVHGFIKDGGQAVNVIVERARAEFSVRARDLVELERIKAIVVRCARAAAMASDVELELSEQRGYLDLVTNDILKDAFGAHMRALGRQPADTDREIGEGSTDMGDVSHAMPAIHPWVAICRRGEAMIHQKRFASAGVEPPAFEALRVAAKAMGRLAIQLTQDPKLVDAAKSAWSARRDASQ